MIDQQWRILIACILCGMMAMFLYDGLRIIRNLIVHIQWIISLEDICYWILVAILFSWLIFRYNDGSLRAFILIGFITGVSIVNWGISCWSVPLCTRLLRMPFRLLARILGSIRYIFNKIFQKFSKKASQNQRYPLD